MGGRASPRLPARLTGLGRVRGLHGSSCAAAAIATLDRMCGRYTTAADRVKFDDIFKPAKVEKTVEKAVGRYNVAPTQQVVIIERTDDDERRATTARWSLVPRRAKSIKDRPQWINARSDKVLTSKVWRSLAARHGAAC